MVASNLASPAGLIPDHVHREIDQGRLGLDSVTLEANPRRPRQLAAEVPEVEEHLKERMMTQAPLGVQLLDQSFEWHVLMLKGR